MADLRRINDTWIAEPRRNEFYIFGRVGSGKRDYIATLFYTNNHQKAMKAHEIIHHILRDNSTAIKALREIKQRLGNFVSQYEIQHHLAPRMR